MQAGELDSGRELGRAPFLHCIFCIVCIFCDPEHFRHTLRMGVSPQKVQKIPSRVVGSFGGSPTTSAIRLGIPLSMNTIVFGKPPARCITEVDSIPSPGQPSSGYFEAPGRQARLSKKKADGACTGVPIERNIPGRFPQIGGVFLGESRFMTF